jgi:hypothetical protein
MNANDISLSQLADPGFANQSEIDAIVAIHPQLKSCQKEALEGLSQTTPSIVPILAASYTKGDDDLLFLIQQKISWGDFNKRRRDEMIAGQAAIQAELQHMTANLERSHEAELARRQAAFDALARWSQTQQMINAASKPVITNCAQMGFMLNCVSQ